MRVLFDIGHPAHVHLFKNPRRILLERGHEVFVISRDKEIARYLLEAYKIDYFPGTKQRFGISSGFELLEWFWKVFRLIGKLQIDLVASIGSPGGAWAAKLRGIPHLAFNDTEKAFLQRIFYKPASKRIYTPDCYRLKLGKKHIKYRGFHELSYLRPEYFDPNPGILDELGVKQDEPFVIMRFVKWGATHDFGQSGISPETKIRVIKEFTKQASVFITSEDDLPANLKKYKVRIAPEKIHDAMYFASLFFGESPTMTTESAILGTPAICISSWACECGNFIALKERYDIIKCFTKGNGALEIALRWLDDNAKNQWQTKRQKLLDDTIDVAEYISTKIVEYGRK